MKTQYISGVAALLIGSVAINSSVIAGPGPQDPPSLPKHSYEKMPMILSGTKAVRSTESQKKSPVAKPSSKPLTTGQSTVVVR